MLVVVPVRSWAMATGSTTSARAADGERNPSTATTNAGAAERLLGAGRGRGSRPWGPTPTSTTASIDPSANAPNMAVASRPRARGHRAPGRFVPGPALVEAHPTGEQPRGEAHVEGTHARCPGAGRGGTGPGATPRPWPRPPRPRGPRPRPATGGRSPRPRPHPRPRRAPAPGAPRPRRRASTESGCSVSPPARARASGGGLAGAVGQHGRGELARARRPAGRARRRERPRRWRRRAGGGRGRAIPRAGRRTAPPHTTPRTPRRWWPGAGPARPRRAGRRRAGRRPSRCRSPTWPAWPTRRRPRWRAGPRRAPRWPRGPPRPAPGPGARPPRSAPRSTTPARARRHRRLHLAPLRRTSGSTSRSSALTASKPKRPLSHSQLWFNGSLSMPSRRVTRLDEDWTAARQPKAHRSCTSTRPGRGPTAAP